MGLVFEIGKKWVHVPPGQEPPFVKKEPSKTKTEPSPPKAPVEKIVSILPTTTQTYIIKKETKPRYTGVPEEIKFLGLEREYIKASQRKPVGSGTAFEKMWVFQPFQRQYYKTFTELPPVRRFEYGLRFGGISKEPVSKWRYYEGGLEYILGLPKYEQERLLGEYRKTKEWETYITSPRGIEQLKDIKTSIAYEGLSPLDLVTLMAVPEEKALSRLAHQKFFTSPEKFEYTHWESLDTQTRAKRLVKEGYVSFGLFFPTLIETGLSYITGEGSLFDPLSRIKTGKTPTPISTWQRERMVSYTPGWIEAPISEVITGGKSPAFEKLSEKPERIWEATIKTGAGFFGMVAGGGMVSYAKVGIGKITKPVARGIESYFGIPSLSAYRPINLLRKAYWMGREKLGYAKYLPEKQVWDISVLTGKSKFAELPGATKQLRLFEKTRYIDLFPDKKIIGIHTTEHGFGKLTWIRKGTSETPGLSISAFGRGSPRFLRVTGGPSSSGLPTGISLFPKLYKPTAPLFSLEKILRLPRGVRYSFKGSAKYLKGLPRGKYAHIAPKVEMGGPEIEAIISKGTWGYRISSYYYTTYKGVVVPLPHYKLFGSGMSGVSEIEAIISKGTKGYPVSSYYYTTHKGTVIPHHKLLESGMPGGPVTRGISKLPEPVKDFFRISYQSKPSVSLINLGYISSLFSKVSKVSYIPSYKSKVGYPSYPSYKSKTSYPGVSSVSSLSSLSSYISRISKISYPSYKSKTSYGSYISKLSKLSYVSKPSYPSYPGYLRSLPPPPYYDELPLKPPKIEKQFLKFDLGYKFRKFKLSDLFR